MFSVTIYCISIYKPPVRRLYYALLICALPLFRHQSVKQCSVQSICICRYPTNVVVFASLSNAEDTQNGHDKKQTCVT
ncbi:hypothetical protein VTL71DRAFT_2567 [Oculimacula yallundae]|uniref:Secreted protein n=1 Tax=Oculimacula yallundae TaxID=86028 RepID=A0ABR4CB65_9HELO